MKNLEEGKEAMAGLEKNLLAGDRYLVASRHLPPNAHKLVVCPTLAALHRPAQPNVVRPRSLKQDTAASL